MTHKTTVALVASSAFVGGVATGLLTASKTGRAVCLRLVDTLRQRTQCVEAQKHDVQDQVRTLERQVVRAGQHVGEQLSYAVARARLAHRPPQRSVFPSWNVYPAELTRELPHLPHA